MAYPKAVCVFCGASNDAPQIHLDLGRDFGQKMAENNIRLVYGGGDCGIMGAVANAVMKQGGKVTGVFPESLKNIENEHQSLTEIIMVETMHQRKELMYQRSSAFVILPGGFGTMDEMFEILTWRQLKLHDKPIIIMNNQGYWNNLVALMNEIIAKGFAKPEVSSYFQVVDDLESLMEAIEAAENRRLQG
jgi:uncharacterized protein (TIGR00730 family)